MYLLSFLLSHLTIFIPTILRIRSCHVHIRHRKKYSALFYREGFDPETEELKKHYSHDHRLIVSEYDYKNMMETLECIEELSGVHDMIFEHEYLVFQNKEEGIIPFSQMKEDMYSPLSAINRRNGSCWLAIYSSY